MPPIPGKSIAQSPGRVRADRGAALGADFTFIATGTVSGYALYEAPWQAGTQWTGYLVPLAGVPPAAISYADSLSAVKKSGAWQALYPGFYLFAPTRPLALDSDPAGFADAIAAYLKSQKLQVGSQAVLWLKGVDPLVFPAPFSKYAIIFSCDAFSGNFQTNSNLNAALGASFTFNILANTGVSVDAGNGCLRFTVPVSSSQGIRFLYNARDCGISLLSDGSFVSTFVPFAGANTGCCLFSATLQPAAAFGTPGLLPGFQYTASIAAAGGTAGGSTQAFFYPAFVTAALPSSLTCAGSVDILDPFNQLMPAQAVADGVLRTGFILTDGTALPSCWRTAEGTPATLTPLGGTAAKPSQPPAIPLQAGGFALTTSSAVPSDPTLQSSVASLTLCGRFGVAAGQAAGQPLHLLCGIFGSEKLTLTAYDRTAANNDALLFRLASSAYAPVFPFTTVSLNAPASGSVVQPLTGSRYTAWATVLQGGASSPTYSAEPAGSPMFGFPAGSGGEADDDAIILESQPPSLPLPQGSAHAFPLVPYAGLTGATPTGATLASFESSILAATRKQTVSSGAQTTWTARAQAGNRARHLRLSRQAGAAEAIGGGEPTQYRATPQGLIATVDPGSGAYLTLTLGQTPDSHDGTQPFGFLSPTPVLQDALQTNQLFLVIVNPDNLVPEADDFLNRLDIAGWRMAAKVGKGVSATAYANVMVMKYCDGSFKSRITNPNQWTAPADFSLPSGTDPASTLATTCYTGLSSWLQTVVKQAEAALAANPDSPYANFVQLVNDPDWNGVLVLQADLDAGSLPDGLAGIAAGIDMTSFTAHHFGFTASRLSSNSDGTISFASNSSTFGLVDYTDSTFAANLALGLPPDTPITLPIAVNYAFRVLQLQTLFENAAIRTFKSYLELGVGNLFSTPVLSTIFNGSRMPGNGVVLDGSYVDQNGVGIYIFVQAVPTIFQLDSNVLPSVAFNRVQFNCLGTTDGGSTVLNRFFIWGSFNFTALTDKDGAPLDLLSFGDPAGAGSPSGAGLSFSSLLIDMRYPAATPNAVTFVEGTQNLSYDLGNSVYRPGSLFGGFGLQLSGFIAAGVNERPADYGFLTVTAPVDLSPLRGPWYGVTYRVTMGGPGALASAAGFNSTLLLGWSPASGAGDDAHSLFIGLSLPGAAPGAKLISLQGVFKLSVDTLALSRQQVPDSDPASYYYCLKLGNIGLKILGIAKLPPDATINFFLFGDPGSTGSLGWYAAYIAKDS